MRFLLPLLLAGCSSLLYYPSSKLYFDPVAVGLHPQDLTLESEDGTGLHGWYFTHAGAGKAKALVLLFHGNAENISSHYMGAAWLLNEGYDLMLFDYRGYGRSAGEPSPAGTVLDGKAALRLAATKNLPLVVYGQSLGGAIALRSLIELKNEMHPRAIVIESSFASYRQVGRSVLSKSYVTWLFQPLGYLLLSDRAAPGERVKELSPTPLLVVHGEKDPVVPATLGQQIFDWAGEPKTLWLLPEAQHINAFWVEKGKYRPKLLEWLKQALSKS